MNTIIKKSQFQWETLFAERDKHTPMMRQFLQLKSQHPEYLLLYRLGDFYEMFFDDAYLSHRILNITLTSRGQAGQEPIPMAGIPYHALDAYLPKLIDAGIKVALCEQHDADNNQSQLIEREVVRLITPGTYFENAHQHHARCLAAAIRNPSSETIMIACFSLSNSHIQLLEIPDLDQLKLTIPLYGICELLVPFSELSTWLQHDVPFWKPLLSPCPHWFFDSHRAKSHWQDLLPETDLAIFGLSDDSELTGLIAAILLYLEQTQRRKLCHITKIIPPKQNKLEINAHAVWQLALLPKPGELLGESLLENIDFCLTPMGKRLLRQRLVCPSFCLDTIGQRQHQAQSLSEANLRSGLEQLLDTAGDVEKIVSRLQWQKITSADLYRLRATLKQVPMFLQHQPVTKSCSFHSESLHDLLLILDNHLQDDPNPQASAGQVLADACDHQLPLLRQQAKQAGTPCQDYLGQLRQTSQLMQLKIGQHQTFGWYLELPKNQAHKAPPSWKLLQMLKNVVRYTDSNLQQLHLQSEQAVRALAIHEQICWQKLLTACQAFLPALQSLAMWLTEWDVSLAAFKLSQVTGWCWPEMHIPPHPVDIQRGWHPVVASHLEGAFQANSLVCHEPIRLHLITGPNMGGKSTYMRQVALIVILAQMGYPVPAQSASLPLFDRIFTRIGADDALCQGQSTFMVEMRETATICHCATKHSLVLLDEIGRGTNHEDGLAIAWAVANYLATSAECFTLFSSHYLELAERCQQHLHMANYQVLVETIDQQFFLTHLVAPGASNCRLGLSIAKLAGLPEAVISYAKQELCEQQSMAEEIPHEVG